MERDEYDYEDDMPAGHVLCPRCVGHREVSCHCGGDLCVCENNGEMECPMCHGEGDVKKERADKYLARQAEYASPVELKLASAISIAQNALLGIKRS